MEMDTNIEDYYVNSKIVTFFVVGGIVIFIDKSLIDQHAAPRPALALHPGAHVPPGERHRGQRARADHAAEDGGQ